MDLKENFEKLLESGTDNAMLRFGLGNAYHQAGEFEKAIVHLRKAVEQDPGYSAAWKLLGKALAESGQAGEARQAFTRGIDCAERKGDVQATKEMRVFLKRLERERS